MDKLLNQAKALIFRIIHRDNVPWILDNGLHCKNSKIIDPQYVPIGNPELIDKRNHRTVQHPPGGTLSDYVPFYFTPFSPMLLNINTGHNSIRKRGNDEIVILVSSCRMLKERNIPFLFTDRHAYLTAAQFFSDLTRLDQIDWAILQKRDFQRDPDDPGKLERYQAEALVHMHLPIDAFLGMVCYNDSVAANLKEHLVKRGLEIEIRAIPRWYFR